MWAGHINTPEQTNVLMCVYQDNQTTGMSVTLFSGFYINHHALNKGCLPDLVPQLGSSLVTKSER